MLPSIHLIVQFFKDHTCVNEYFFYLQKIAMTFPLHRQLFYCHPFPHQKLQIETDSPSSYLSL